jgi:ADP-ribosylglycohydrolase
MRYSLLSRFRGSLLGSLLGDMLPKDAKRQVLGKITLIRPHPKDENLSESLSDWSYVATCGTESLIRCGYLDLEDWAPRNTETQPTLALLKNTASSSSCAVATLPVALFFHEDEIKLRQKLLQASQFWLQDGEDNQGVLAVGYAIALALTEKLNCVSLIGRILSYLGNSQTPLTQQLQQIQILLEQGAGLEKTLKNLICCVPSSSKKLKNPDISIALALYCFLSTPEDFRLSVTRAILSNYQPLDTAILTGAISGVYNSIISIPVGWRLAANQLNSTQKRLRLAESLFAVWSGIYDVSSIEQFPNLAVAAPRVIQPR